MSTTTLTGTVTASPEATRRELTTLARWAGGLGLAQVVLMFAGMTQEVMAEHSTPLATLQHDYGTADLTRVFGGGYVEATSFLLLAPAIVIIARLFARVTETTRVAAQTFLALGVAFLAATLAIGFAPGAAAAYGAQHGADIHAVAMVSDLRNYSYYLQVTIQGGMAIALGIAAILGRTWARSVGWGGVVGLRLAYVEVCDADGTCLARHGQAVERAETVSLQAYGAPVGALRRSGGCSWSTTTRSSARVSPGCSNSPTTWTSPTPSATRRRPSAGALSSSPTSSSWTSTCPGCRGSRASGGSSPRTGLRRCSC